MNQRLRIKKDAAPHENLQISFQLFISQPGRQDIADVTRVDQLQLIESHKVKIQIARGHIPSTEDNVLLVTTPVVKKAQLDAIVRWLEDDLGLKTNVWNLGIYGGLLFEDPAEEGTLRSVLPAYAGKLVIFLGDHFELAGQTASILQVCDGDVLQEASDGGAAFVFFGANNDPAMRHAFNDLLRPLQEDPIAIARSLPHALRFEKQSDLIRCLQGAGDGSRYHLLSIKKSRVRTDATRLSHAAKKLESCLGEQVPHAHFIVCVVPGEGNQPQNQAYGSLLVWQGFSRTDNIFIATADLFEASKAHLSTTASMAAAGAVKRALTVSRSRMTMLSPFDQFSILAAVPFSWKLNMLMGGGTIGPAMSSLNLVVLSMCAQIDNEIQLFLTNTNWPNSVAVDNPKMLETFLPCVHKLISQVLEIDVASSHLNSVIKYCLASIRPQSGAQSLSQKVVPFGHRRKQLFNHITKSTLGKNTSNVVTRNKLRKVATVRESQIFRGIAESSLALPDQRCVSKSLDRMIEEATGKPQNFQEHARYGVRKALTANEVISIEEWQRVAQRSGKQREDMLDIYLRFQAEIEKHGVGGDEEASVAQLS
jgi:hypothetical protein